MRTTAGLGCLVSRGLLTAGLALLSLAPPIAAQPERQQIRLYLEHASEDQPLRVGGEPLYATRVLPAFYERRLFLPAWSPDSQPSTAPAELVAVLRQVGAEGLDASRYHQASIEELLPTATARSTPAELAELDLLLTDAFLILGAHLVSGRVDPETLDPEWKASRREVDLGATLDEALRLRAPSAALESLWPDHAGYRRLRRALATYRQLAGDGWPTIAEGPALRPGDTSDRVRELRVRLVVTDGAESSPSDAAELYDEGLEAALRRFQRRHGLDADGVLGEKSLTALNVPAAERVHQIELNLERWRWLPQHLGDRYVLVNIPEFGLVVMEGESRRLEMPVAVGRRYRRTPVFSDAMRYLVLNPYWDVPHRLAVQDKLPEIQKDPDYLARQGFRVYQGWGADQVAIDPTTVDWSQLSANRFPYRLRQDPGPLNALGRIKFMFPNRFNVYLHDTPTRDTFSKPERDVSSGCIRLERPLDLAELLLAPTSRWGRAAVLEAIAAGKETVVPLERPVPVHLLYWTAWATEEGSVHFRRDVYGRDALLTAALAQPAEVAP